MTMFRRGVECALVAALIAGVGGVASAQLSGDEAVTKRRAEMIVIGRGSGMVRAGGQAASLDEATLALVKTEADKLVASFTTLSDDALWPAGSTHEAFGASKAKAEIWTNNAAFKAGMKASLDAAIALQAAVETGDPLQIRPAQATLQNTCGGCHTDFRI